MVTMLRGRNVNTVYENALQHLRISGVQSTSRNGQVIRSHGPVISEYRYPMERVLWCPTRDANPVFHLLEGLWMLAGLDDVTHLEEFNPRMRYYAEQDGTLHGAYGYRWRHHFDRDQLWGVVRMLQREPTTRRAVLAMWDPVADLGSDKKDLPCNTHIYFNLDEFGRLDMTVCCRSNDAIWGAYGANVVHMSMLHEWVCGATELPMGIYRQFSNDFHVYPQMPRFQEIWSSFPDPEKDLYTWRRPQPRIIPMLHEGGTLAARNFLLDCRKLFEENTEELETPFIRDVAYPLMMTYRTRKACNEWRSTLNRVDDCDWKLAFILWADRREVK